ncbi:hypothetical protein B0J15DRAFT_446817 [Fusarium solani]|uniref:Monocarboxylate transporter 4 n=1 Tax=Fusarium solani TaxID=169388 RepID=A0A9P9HCD8_FUSSL|nr:uncharacterized protein B0J15DRAFT_446817 [Fusarium solani]KAH7254780.1 hypothetical protein B0J15DRAFT_446817 [Fusarium solani]
MMDHPEREGSQKSIPSSDLSQPATPSIDMQHAATYPLQQPYTQNDGSRQPQNPGHQSQSAATSASGVSASPDGLDNGSGRSGEVPSPSLPQFMPSTPPKIGTRFSSRSVRTLRNWFSDHESHPYPSPKDVEMLQSQTGLSGQQITNWLGNFRRRYKFRALRPVSLDIRNWVEPSSSSQGVMNIPPRRPTPVPMEHMDPLQRWENSPPQHEAAAVSDISRAVAAAVGSPSAFSPARPRTSEWSRSSAGTASSVSSAGTSCSSRGSGSQLSASSHASHTSLEYLKRSTNRRRRGTAHRRQRGNWLNRSQVSGRFQCTFCTESFKTKYDWERHEKSLHLSLEAWVCSPKGSVETHPDEGVLCVYCGDANPDQAHLKKHNNTACIERPFEERTFYRKDHLRQHLKLVHGAKYVKWPMETWRTAIKDIRSRCGFCGIEMESWSSRTDHLASHFKDGRTMADWTGDWGFEPSVIEMLDNAIPPYLIHYEKNSPLPFSALAGPADTPSSAYELIKLEWEYYMRDYHDTHAEDLSDEKMQYEACSIIFGAEAISEDHPCSAPSWLRDLLMANHDVTEQARIQPMNQLTKSRMSPLKINGKRNIFEGCELEGSLCRYIGMHIILGLQLSDHDLQQEACHAISRLETPSPNPSKRFTEFLVRLIWDSTEWLGPLRERGRFYSEREMTDECPHPLDMAHLDSFMGQAYPIDPQQGPFGIFLPSELPNLVASLEQSETSQLPASLLWTPALETAQPSMQPFVEPFPSRWAPTMSESTFNSSHLNPSINSISVTPFFLNDNNSYRRLTRELSRFVVSCMSPNNPNSHVPSDEELKYQARWILYDDDDPWNQTPVDNVEWLSEFKRSVGLSVDGLSQTTTPSLPK